MDILQEALEDFPLVQRYLECIFEIARKFSDIEGAACIEQWDKDWPEGRRCFEAASASDEPQRLKSANGIIYAAMHNIANHNTGLFGGLGNYRIALEKPELFVRWKYKNAEAYLGEMFSEWTSGIKAEESILLTLLGTPSLEEKEIIAADFLNAVVAPSAVRSGAFHGTKITASLDSALPEKMIVYADVLKSVLTNYLQNALRYSFKNTEIVVSAALMQESILQVSVTNQGEISADEIDKIFSYGVRGQGVTTKGSGVGLWHVAQSAALVGAKCAVQSRGGTTIFSVEIPFSTLQPSPEPVGGLDRGEPAL